MIDFGAPIKSWFPVVWYPGYLPSLPDLCVGRWPTEFRRSGHEAYKLWYIENPKERELLLAALDRPVPRQGVAIDFTNGPDAATRKPSKLSVPFCAYYLPPEEGWPYLVVTGIRGAPANMGLGRGVYAYDVFETENGALEHLAKARALVPSATVVVPDIKKMY